MKKKYTFAQNTNNRKGYLFQKIIFLGLLFFYYSCDKKMEKKTVLFEEMNPKEMGISFENRLTFQQDFNVYTYRNYYNGGGVGLGDFNNDGLLDIYFTANMLKNKLYLNKGNWQFEDITEKAGVEGKRSWSTGVSIADVDGDGWVDIYVCNSGSIKGDNKQNELFINNRDSTFRECAEEYGLADRGYSTHAAFFDYDRDGDLDMYLLNNSYQAIGSFNLKKNERPVRDSLGGDKLLRNDTNRFTDVSKDAGIYGSIIGFGLGVTVGDINKDGWQDIYVSNDFFERDYLYINQQNGAFKEVLEEQIRSVSAASMGADLADINNDGYPDIFVTDMLPEHNERIKTVTTFDSWDRYQYGVTNNYWHQFTRNTLQLNNGDNTFSEIGRLAGVSATDWSWGALIFDFENDGYKDIFVANGIYQDLTNQDFLNFVTEEETIQKIISPKGVDYKKLVELIPSVPLQNYAFINNKNLQFTNKADELGFSTPSFSNGSAYGDLDNDGDWDLVINNVNMPIFLYKNNTEKQFPHHTYIQIIFTGENKNTAAFGTKITAKHKGETFYCEQMPVRGFQSSVDPRPIIGLGNIKVLDTLLIEFPSQKYLLFTKIPTNKTLIARENEAQGQNSSPKEIKKNTLFREVTHLFKNDFSHRENDYVHFDKERLIYQMASTEGPCLCTGYVNGDSLVDFYLGGAKGFSGKLYIQNADNTFSFSQKNLFEKDKNSEDTDCIFFDADNNGTDDLYVCSGGVEFSSASYELIDRFYINKKGVFEKSPQMLPSAKTKNSSTIAVHDFDNDGDTDIFVGTRTDPDFYGIPSNNYILQNDGKGNFTDVTKKIAPSIQKIGLITDALWADIDNDTTKELIVVGEWMPISVFKYSQKKFINITQNTSLQNTEGWWNTIESADLNKDGKIDFVVGNIGLNTRFRFTTEKPISLFINDFDQNGNIEQILSQYDGEKSYPIPLKHDLVKQIPSLKKKYLKYETYKHQTIEQIFTPKQLEKALKKQAKIMETIVLINKGNGNFLISPLPIQAQFSPVKSILIHDFNTDNIPDILLGGNFFEVKPEIGRYDAHYGQFWQGNGDGTFQFIKNIHTGFFLTGQIRKMKIIPLQNKEYIFVAKNNAPMQIFLNTYLKHP